MKRNYFLLMISALMAASALGQPDLTGLKFCIDPGHGGHNSNDRHLIPDPGIDFWESESNFQKALLLKSLLEAKGAYVILTRTSNDTTGYPVNDGDPDEPGLSARVALANANNVDWFHSIHSNAIGNGLQSGTSVNYTLMLVREKRPGGPSSGSGNGLGIPELPESWTMATFMSPRINAALRTNSNMTFLDYTFYQPNPFSLGVLRGLLMPGELSEGSMHDYAPETRRLMNNDYRKMEAYALRNSIMQYYNVPADTLGIIAGIQKDIGSALPINLTQVRLSPENRVYNGDAFNNGFYAFDALKPGLHTIHFQTPGYMADSIQVTVVSGSTTFADRTLESFASPAIILSSPVNNDTAFAASLPIRVTFSKPMNVTSVQNAFTITPLVSGTFSWSNNNTVMAFAPSSILPFYVDFTVRIDTSAHSASGQTLDGNGDGTPGDAFVLRFRTRFIDAVPPKILTRFPDSSMVLTSTNHVLNITFNEPLDPISVTRTNFAIQLVGGSALAQTAQSPQYWEAGGKGGVNMYTNVGFESGKSYRVRVSGVKDKAGNPIPDIAAVLWDFSVAPATYQFKTIDAFDASVANWLSPSASGSTTGIDSARFVLNSATTLPTITSNTGSGLLSYHWDTTAAQWLIREALDSSAAKKVLWKTRNTLLQVYINGDGSGTRFRFAVDDSVEAFPAGNSTNHEVSTWHTIDWVGWRLVQWDLEHDSVGTWVGNGKLEGDLRFDSFQLQFVPGASAPVGTLYFDQLQIAEKVITSVSGREPFAPTAFALYQNYPNPFNPTTTIAFDVPAGVTSPTRLVVYDVLGRHLRTLVDEMKSPGRYVVSFDAQDIATGVYVYRLEAGATRLSRKLILTK